MALLWFDALGLDRRPMQDGHGPGRQATRACELAEAGVEVVIDDRDERAGVKFADADLIGWPYQVVVGKKGVAAGVVEVKTRATGERVEVPLAEAAKTVADMVRVAKQVR